MASKFTRTYIKELAYKWERGLLTASEKADFEAWYNNYDDERAELPTNYDKEEVIEERLLSRLVSHINTDHSEKKLGKRYAVAWLAAASVMLVMFSIAAFIYLKEATEVKQQSLATNDINPGSNKATLTLADGRKINLDMATDGKLAEESGIKITKTADGQIIYELVPTPKTVNIEASYNTIETPKGGQYKIVLPDSSRVWLNAASSLKYPTNFSAENRTVELKGEAYFEVSPDKQRPFLVKSDRQLTRVLGTQFNISAYEEEETVKTTLVEGAVSVVPSSISSSGASHLSTVLKPGEQSTMLNGKTSVAKVDLAPYISWKKGVFYFDETKLTEAMSQLSRWYDVEVVYSDKVPDTYFYGEISRTKTLSEVLAILQEGGVKFKIEKAAGKNKLFVY
ncbi:MAG TPA: FecR domain-containing protein [Pseudosphingobacterium sp.]|nr:FecR domain-containing protein [Pseudosphingobacterium sp.]